MELDAPKEPITPESFRAAIVGKCEELDATAKITEGFGGSAEFTQKAREQRVAREKIKDEIAAITGEALTSLDYDTVMGIFTKEMRDRSYFIHDEPEMLEKILRSISGRLLESNASTGTAPTSTGTAETGDAVKKTLDES